MKTFLIQVILMLAPVALSFYLCYVNGKSDFEVQPLSSKEIDHFYKNGSLKDHYNAAYQMFHKMKQKLKESERVAKISGFVCTCLLIQDLLKIEYQIAEQNYPDRCCYETWIMYIRNSERPTAIKLRNSFGGSEDLTCGLALCNAKYIANEHVHYTPSTVQVALKLKDGTNDTIFQILEEEKPKFLFTLQEMSYVNMYAKACGDIPFPYNILVKDGYKYAIPQLRSSSDLKTCPSLLCKNE